MEGGSRRDDLGLDGIAESPAVRGGVVEAVQGLPAVVPVAGVPGVPRDLKPEVEEPSPEFADGGSVGQLPFGHEPPGRFPDLPVRFLVEGLHLLQGLFLAFPQHRLGPDDPRVLRVEFLFFHQEGDVFLAVELCVGPQPPEGNPQVRGFEARFQQALSKVLLGGLQGGRSSSMKAW